MESDKRKRDIRRILPSRLYKYVSQYLNSKTVLALDCCLSLFSSVIILLLVSYFAHYPQYYHGTFSLWWMTGSLVGTLISALSLKYYKIIIRHSQIRDLMKLLNLALLKVAIMAVILAFAGRIRVPVIIILCADCLFTACLMIGARLSMLVVYDIYRNRVKMRRNIHNVLVYGTSDKSISIITRLMESSHYNIVGFVEPGKEHKSLQVADLKVYTYEDEDEFKQIAEKLSLDYVLFATEKAAQAEKDHLVKYCSQNGVGILITPGIDEVSGDSLTKHKVREIKIEDLLGREEIKIDNFEYFSDAHQKTVLVTGAAGSIGSELCRQLARYGVKNLILFDNAETPIHNLRLEMEDHFGGQEFVPVIGDVRQERRLDFVFRTYRPDIVFHAAAYKHVPLMEENPCEAVLVNVIGSRNVADKCLEYGVEKMVMISTDKAVNPTNIMGCTKRLAEIYVQSLGLALEKGEKQGTTRFITTRFGNVLGSSGSVIPRFREQIASGGPVTVTDPRINRFFMTIPEACRLVMEASVISRGNEICVFDMGRPVKIDDLARKMIELAGLTVGKDIEIAYTGLRPGEKLYEEVLSSTENTDPTPHDRIRVARVRQYEYKDAASRVEELEALARAVDIPEMVKLMKRMVPEFISNNSRFSIYDNK